jgi:hypothetical protein
MPISPLNDWNVSYSMIAFFERALKGHSRVERFTRTRDIFFDIELTNGIVLKVLLVDEYTLGLAALHRAQSEFPEMEFIVTGANWNGYTQEAKEYGKLQSIGVFNVEEFFGALHWSEPKKYYQKDSRGRPVYAYK